MYNFTSINTRKSKNFFRVLRYIHESGPSFFEILDETSTLRHCYSSCRQDLRRQYS